MLYLLASLLQGKCASEAISNQVYVSANSYIISNLSSGLEANQTPLEKPKQLHLTSQNQSALQHTQKTFRHEGKKTDRPFLM
jgi:hypothetical protein